MMYLDPNYDDGGYGGTGGTGDTGGTDSGTTGGSDPTNPPRWKPGPNGWWQFFDGVWRWMTEPVPRTIAVTG